MPRVKAPRSCCRCGSRLTAPKKGTRYCSLECKASARAERAPAPQSRSTKYQRRRSSVPKLCDLCRRPFESAHDDVRHRYCSTLCNQRAEKHVRSAIFVRDCDECGELFVGRKHTSLVCSSACRRKREARRHAEWEAADPSRRRRRTGYARRTSAVRRSAKVGAAVVDADVTVDVLHVRDGGICAVCGGFAPLVYGATRRNRPSDMATIDHVRPLARGGEHSWANVQLAHLACNLRKHAKEAPR